MSSKCALRHVLLSSCCFGAAAILSALPAGAADYPVTSGTQTVTSAITGTDTLTKTGSGTYILTAANTSTGTTTISAGTLQIGTTAVASSVFDTTAAIASSSIVDNGTLVFNRGDGSVSTAPSYTYAGVISGTGALKQIGYGTLILTGNNTYTGTTTLASTTVTNADATTTTYGAVLQLGNGGTTGWIGSSSIINGSGSTLIFNRSDDVTWSGVISSSGAVTQLGTGVLTFTGVNTVNGATTISAGTLALSGAGSIASSAVTNNSIFDISGVTAATATIKSLAGTGSVVLGAKTLSLTSGATFSGVISGTGGLTINGGTEILTGANTYTGTTTITAGTLQIGSASTTGWIASTTIIDNGTLSFSRTDAVTYSGLISGTGALKQVGVGTLTLNSANTYTGLTTVSAGTLVIGDATHTTASVGGAATVSSSGTLTGYGTIAGALTNAGTVKVGNGSVGTLTVGGAYTQTGTLTAEISPTASSVLNVTGAASLAGTFTATFDAGDYGQTAYLTPILKASSITGTFTTASGTGSTVAYGVVYPTTGTEVDVLVVPKVVGQVYGDVVTQTLENTHVLNDIALTHVSQSSCGDAAVPCKGFSSWIEGIGGTNHIKASNGTMGFNANSWGVIGGLGYAFTPESSVNLAAAYTGNHLGVSGGSASADSTGGFAALTLHAGGPMIAIDTNVFYMFSASDVARDTGLYGTAASSVNNTGGGFTFQVSAPLLGGDVTPSAKVAYAMLSYGPFTETGGGILNLTGVHGSQSAAYYDLGVRFSHQYATDDGVVLKPFAYIGLRENSTEGQPTSAMSLTNFASTSFEAPSATPDKFAGVLRLGVDAKIDNAFSLVADLNSKFGSKQTQAIFSLGGKYRF